MRCIIKLILHSATDIFTIYSYFKEDELVGHAQTLLAMILANVFVQCLFVNLQYSRKSRKRRLKELLMCVTLVRPIVDAYRVGTFFEEEDVGNGTSSDTSQIVISLKCIELATEAIPGCVYQFWVWLKYPDLAGKYALLSILISVLTTGFTSAMISFDTDTASKNRKKNPNFYGYVPDTHIKRRR